MEIALPRAPHTDASYVRRTEAPDRDADYELQRAELDDAETRPICSDLAQVPSIAEYMSAHRLPDLDRSVLAGRHLDLTRTISGHLMRYPFAGHQFAGIRAQSRHSGITFAHFEGHYKLRPLVVGPIRLTPDDPDVRRIAQRIHLVP